MAVKPIPEGYQSLTPYLAVEDATQAIDYYKQAFGATERVIMHGPDGKVGHAELEIGDSIVMLADQNPDSPTRPPNELGGCTGSIFLYTEDVDAVYQRAIDAGAVEKSKPENMFWGDRFGTLTDPFGHVWNIATHVEDVPPQEMEERAKAAMASMGGQG
jgi:PhnB protein